MSKIILKDKRAVDRMRSAGQLLAGVFKDIPSMLVVGMSTLDLDALIEARMRKVNLEPSCIGYGGYRHATCISVNDGVIHGVPSAKVILRDGDCVKVDVVGAYQGYCADMARTYVLGESTAELKNMVCVAQQALDEGINLIKPGLKIGDIAACVQRIVESASYGVVRAYAGHGIGRSFHEAPEVPNYGKAGTGPTLLPGMALAIEPMITQFSFDVTVDADGWTVRTRDGGLAVHVEDTIVVTENGVEVLTRLS